MNSTTILNLQTSSVKFISKYSHQNCLINTLEFNTLSTTEEFSCLFSSNISKNLIGWLVASDDDSSVSFYESFKEKNKASIDSSNKGIMIICDNKEDNYDFVYFLIQGCDPFITLLKLPSHKFGLFKFSIEEMVSNNVENSETLINQLLNVKTQMNSVHYNLLQEDQKVWKENQHSLDAIQYFLYDNQKIKKKKLKLEKKVRKKYQKLENLHNECIREKNLFCSLCNNEKKNILFLPCCHIEVCKTCLIENLKIQVNVPNLVEQDCGKCFRRIENAFEVMF